MNKTVNINLANTFFHIDEEAYTKLSKYLDAIKRSFAGTEGSEEIIADIEARIAELFLEKMEHSRQVITDKEVDEVIATMGQPEDYHVDEDMFDDQTASSANSGETNTKRVKKLYRDVSQNYIGGVCSGLEHYLGLDALWIRLIFVVLTLLGSGFGIIAYILLWILVPEAQTTAQKLDMRGEPINISNIERKVKEGFEGVADKVKSVDYEKMGDKVKSSSQTFFDALGNVILFFFKVIAKLLGLVFVIAGAATLIGLFIGLFTVGIIDLIHIPGVDLMYIANNTNTPIWLITLVAFFAIAIPFFFLMYLGLKMLINNLKSIGNVAKIALVVLWLASLCVLITLGLKQASARAFIGSSSTTETLLNTTPADTLTITMVESDGFQNEDMRFSIDDIKLVFDENGEPILYSEDVRFRIKAAKDNSLQLKVRKDARGSSFEDARNRAKAIDYAYTFNNNTLALNEYLTTAKEQKFLEQEVNLSLHVPAGTIISFEESTRHYIGRGIKNDRDYYRSQMVQYSWVMSEDEELVCLDCPEEEPKTDEVEKETNKISIDSDGIDINIKDKDDSFKMKIDENGVEIKANEN